MPPDPQPPVPANQPAPAKPPPRVKVPVVQNPYFNMLLLIVAALCFLSLILLAVSAILCPNPPTPAQLSLIEACKWCFGATSGALIGLMCGRGGAPDRR